MEASATKLVLLQRDTIQKPGIDYVETFSPIARYDTVRTLVSCRKEKLRQFNVKTAFLYGTLQEEVYMHQPEGYDDGSGRVCRLKKSLYGSKQASQC